MLAAAAALLDRTRSARLCAGFGAGLVCRTALRLRVVPAFAFATTLEGFLLVACALDALDRALTGFRAALLLVVAFFLGLAFGAARDTLRLVALAFDGLAAALRGFGVRVLRVLDFTTFFMPSDTPVLHESGEIDHAIFSMMAL